MASRASASSSSNLEKWRNDPNNWVQSSSFTDNKKTMKKNKKTKKRVGAKTNKKNTQLKPTQEKKISKQDKEDIDSLISAFKKTYKYFAKKHQNPKWAEFIDIIESVIFRLIKKKYWCPIKKKYMAPISLNKLEELYKEMKNAMYYRHDGEAAMNLSPTNIFINPFAFITKNKSYLSWEKIMRISKNEYFYKDGCKTDNTLLEEINESQPELIYQCFYYNFINERKQVGKELYLGPIALKNAFGKGFNNQNIEFNTALFNTAIKNNSNICIINKKKLKRELICPSWIYDWEVQTTNWLTELYEKKKNLQNKRL